MYGGLGKGTHLFVPLDVVPSKSNNKKYQARVP